MFGFTAQFCETYDGSFNDEFKWKSINELAANVRQIGKKLRVLNEFDDGLNELNELIKILFNNYKLLPLSKWIRDNSFQRVNDLIFGKIQTITYPFYNNKQSEKSLKTSVINYYNFIHLLSELSHKNNTPPLIIFTKNQRKSIYKFHSIILAIKDDETNLKLTDLEKENMFFNRLKHENVIYNIKTACTNDEISIEKYLKSDRIKRAEYILQNRTDRIILILDGCYDIYNQYAMLRSAEIFGIQTVFIIRPIEYKNINICNKISKSSQQWLDVTFFNSSIACINELKGNNKHKDRKIWVMDVGKDAMELSCDIIMKSNLKNKNKNKNKNNNNNNKEYFAIVMGEESNGASKEFLEICDKKIYLSQFGFTESFNVSAACCIMLNNIFLMYPNMRGDMNENDRNKLRIEWWNKLINQKSIQNELNKYLKLTNNNNNNNVNDTRLNSNQNKPLKATKYKINHVLRDNIKSQLLPTK